MIGRISATAVHRSHGRYPAEGFRRLGAYAFVFVLAGRGQYQDEQDVNVRISHGDLILLFPSLGHAYGPDPSSHWVERYVVFDGPVFDLWERAGMLPSSRPVVRLGDVEDWNSRIDSVFGESTIVGTIPTLEAVCRLQLFLAQALAAGSFSNTLSSGDHDWLSRACALLSTFEPGNRQDLTLSAIAESLSLSYDGFRKRFTKLAGISPGQYRTHRLIERACELIQTGIVSDRQIAESLGFYDQAHFSKRFKQVVGSAPSEFRRSLPTSRQ